MKLFRFETTVENTEASFVDWYEGRTEDEAKEDWSEDIHRYGLQEDNLTVSIRLATASEIATIGWMPSGA